MIKIDSSRFDWDEINSIYEALSEKVSKRIEKELKKDTLPACVKDLLNGWFCDTRDVVDPERLRKYLADQHPEKYPKEYIEEFVQCIGDIKNVAEYNAMRKQWEKEKETLYELSLEERKKEIGKLRKSFALPKADVKKDTAKRYTKDYIQNLDITEGDYKEQKILKPLRKIFNYKNDSEEFRTPLLKAMNLSVCPYCNRQFITSVSDGNSKYDRATADIDHFYLKKEYPFLALSLYNFIPSCQICNSKFKGKKDFYKSPEHVCVYPYQEEFGEDCVFKIEGISGIVDKKNPEFKLVNYSGTEKIDHSIETFRLNDVYAAHGDYVKELITKTRLYSESQIEEYLKGYSDLFGSRKELMQLLYGNYVSLADADRRPLAKLTHDILKDLGVILEDLDVIE